VDGRRPAPRCRTSSRRQIGGYLTLLYARYWAGRGLQTRSSRLAINCWRSIQLALHRPALAPGADSEVKRGRADRALATLQSLLKDIGSPLVPVVRQTIAALEAAEKSRVKR